MGSSVRPSSIHSTYSDKSNHSGHVSSQVSLGRRQQIALMVTARSSTPSLDQVQEDSQEREGSTLSAIRAVEEASRQVKDDAASAGLLVPQPADQAEKGKQTGAAQLEDGRAQSTGTTSGESGGVVLSDADGRVSEFGKPKAQDSSGLKGRTDESQPQSQAEYRGEGGREEQEGENVNADSLAQTVQSPVNSSPDAVLKERDEQAGGTGSGNGQNSGTTTSSDTLSGPINHGHHGQGSSGTVMENAGNGQTTGTSASARPRSDTTQSVPASSRSRAKPRRYLAKLLPYMWTRAKKLVRPDYCRPHSTIKSTSYLQEACNAHGLSGDAELLAKTPLEFFLTRVPHRILDETKCSGLKIGLDIIRAIPTSYDGHEGLFMVFEVAHNHQKVAKSTLTLRVHPGDLQNDPYRLLAEGEGVKHAPDITRFGPFRFTQNAHQVNETKGTKVGGGVHPPGPFNVIDIKAENEHLFNYDHKDGHSIKAWTDTEPGRSERTVFFLESTERKFPKGEGIHSPIRFGIFVRSGGVDFVVTAKVDVERHLESRVFAKGPGPEEVSRPVLIPVSSLPTTLQGPSLGREFPAKMEDWSNQILMKLMIVESGSILVA